VNSTADASEDIIDDIIDMELPEGTENSLVSKLENAIEKLKDGDNKTAAKKLESFINQVEAQRGKKLTDEEADALIEAAQEIIDSIT
jgi:hypothetical protein